MRRGPVEHPYTATIVWTGNRGEGTQRYRGYARTWRIATPGKPVIECSNDPLLGGDPALPNPEDLLLSTVSACHMLWYLHLACEAKIVVTSYEDEPLGEGESDPSGAGRFVRVTLRPRIAISGDFDEETAERLHHDVAERCFIARSVAFPIFYEATYVAR